MARKTRGSWIGWTTAVVGAVGICAGVWQIATVLGQPSNPDAGLSDAQRDANYSQWRAESAKEQSDWASSYFATDHDYVHMDRTSITAGYLAASSTLAEAVDKAQIIGYGKVTDVHFTYDETLQSPVADVTFHVETSLKGAVAGSDVHVTQYGGPFMNFTANEVMLEQYDPDPLLLPGDSAILFLQPSPSAPSGLTVEFFTGQYRVSTGAVQVIDGNPFAADVNGLPLATFEQKVRDIS